MTFKQRSIGRTTESLSFIEKPIFPLLLSYGGDYMISEIICLRNGYIIRIYTGMSQEKMDSIQFSASSMRLSFECKTVGTFKGTLIVYVFGKL